MVDAKPLLPGLSAVQGLAEIIHFRMLMIAAGYEDGNDAAALCGGPMFKLALDRLPSDQELCSQSTISRLENLPDIRALLRLGRALIEVILGPALQLSAIALRIRDLSEPEGKVDRHA